MRTKFTIQRKCRIYLFTGPELGNGYVGIEINLKTGAWRKCPWYNGSSKVLKALILKYGRGRFIKRILKEFLFENNIKNSKIESFYMHKYNTLRPDGINGYDPEKHLGFNNTGRPCSEERRKKMKELWENPEFREYIMKIRNRPEVKRKISKAKKEQWENSEFREKRRILINTLEFKEKIGKAISIAWNKPGIKEKIGKAIKEAKSTPEYKEKIRKIMHSTEYKEKMSKVMTVVCNSVEEKKRRSTTMIKLWGDFEFREKRKISAKNKERECEYCGKILDICNYTRHHGNNCKYKPKMKRLS